jgi:hypothetical protein
MLDKLNFLGSHVVTAALIAVATIPTVTTPVSAETVSSSGDKTTNNLEVGAKTLEVAVKTPLVYESIATQGAETHTIDRLLEEKAIVKSGEISAFESLAQPSKVARDLLAQEPTPAPTTEPVPTTPAEPAPTPSTEPSSPGEVFQNPDLGRATRSGSSYVGVGGNIGIVDGNSDVGSGSFVLLSKLGLTYYLALRPSIFIGDNVSVLLPVTYDFDTKAEITEGYPIRPYLGAGIALTFNDSALDLLLTAGIDVPISSRFTATAAANMTPTNNFAFGIMLGIGYNISF